MEMHPPLYDGTHGIIVVALADVKSVELRVLRLEVLVFCVQNFIELLKQFHIQVHEKLWLLEFLEVER